jgi:DNA-binding MarR family transcriptional regulator
MLDRAGAALLKVVANCEGTPCRLQDIATQLGIEAPSVTRTARELKRQKLISKRTDKEDRRATNISLTPEGKQLLERLQAAHRDRLKGALKDWSASDRHELARLLHKMAESLATPGI